MSSEKAVAAGTTNIVYEPRGPAREYSELAANQRVGCIHGCKYCYVPGIPPWKFEDNPKTAFHSRCVVRTGVLARLEKDCRRLAGDPREVLMSFTCDPYVVGADNSVTRAALLTFEKYRMRVQVLTKGGMEAAADFDVLARNGWKFASTLLFSSDAKRREWEPNASTVESRMEAIRRAHRMGIPTWVSVEPVIEPDEALEVIRQLKGHVDLWKVGKLNHMPEVEAQVDWARFLADARAVLGDQPHIIKNDLLAYGSGRPAGVLPAPSPVTPRPERREPVADWTPALAARWAGGAKRHVRAAIKALADGGSPMTTQELNAVSFGSSGGAIVGGLNAWATRQGLPFPVVRRRVDGVARYGFGSEEVRQMFEAALAA